MPNKPKYSIIIPIYNVEQYLSQCVDSVLQQKYSNYEIILVDDGSNDSSGVIADEYAQKDQRILVIHKQNGGLSDARNHGIREAQGDRIIFLDSDDYWSNPNMLSIISDNEIDENSLIIWKYQKCGENEIISYDENQCATFEYTLSNDYKYLFSKGILFASACYMAIPQTWFLDVKMQFIVGETSEDVEWFGSLLQHAEKITLLDAPFYIYRTRTGSISNTVSEVALNTLYKHVVQLYAAKEKSMICKTYLSEQIANLIIVTARCSSMREEFDRKILSEIKYAVRPRSKVIGIAYRILGLDRTKSLLRLKDKNQ